MLTKIFSPVLIRNLKFKFTTLRDLVYTHVYKHNQTIIKKKANKIQIQNIFFLSELRS